MYIKNKIFEIIFNLVIFLLLIAIQLPWINLNGIAVPDTQGYIDVSKYWFNSDAIYFRPIIYPIFIYLSKSYGTGLFGSIVYIQIIFYALSGTLFYNILTLQKININKILLISLVFISFMAPQALHMNQIVLPEMLPLFFVLLLFYFLLKPSKLSTSLIISLLIIIPILTKPIWLLLLSFPFIKFIYSSKTLNNFIYGLLIPITFTLSLYSINQYFVGKNNINKIIASTFDVNTNLALIRMGLIDGAESTKLYSFLYYNGLIPEISNRYWNNIDSEYSNFTQLKNKIPWEFREDYNFWGDILLKNPNNLFKYFSFQISRIPIFFSTSAENGGVVFLFNYLNSIYQKFFSNIHSKNIVGVLFSIFACIIGLFNFTKLTIHKLLFFLILEFAIVLCLLTYQDSHFLRMRSVIEPLIIYVVLYTFIKTAKYLNEKYKFNTIISYLSK